MKKEVNVLIGLIIIFSMVLMIFFGTSSCVVSASIATPSPTAKVTPKATSTPKATAVQTCSPVSTVTPTAFSSVSPTPSTTPTPSPGIISTSGTVNANQVNFRSGPSIKTSIYATVNKGKKISIILKTADWFKTKIAGKTGYIFSKYITLDVIKLKIATVIESVANLRKTAGKNVEIIATMKKCDIVTVFYSKGDWSKVRTWDEKVGFVLRSSIKVEQTVSRGAISRDEKAQKVVDFAMKFIGVKYNYAHASPKEGFDCSGLVWYAYNNSGVTVNRSSAWQEFDGTEVAKTDLKPGDILLFKRDGRIFHAALYIGKGMMLHAEPTDGVNVDILFDNGHYEALFVKAVRIFN